MTNAQESSNSHPPATAALQPTVIASDDPLNGPPQFHPPARVGIHPGTPFLWTVPVSGERPIRFSAEGLPAGLALDAETGTLRGRIDHAGDYAVDMQATNRLGASDAVVHIVAGDQLALTPPMGWNSYDCLGDDATEGEVLATARYIAKYMQPYGWDTLVVDYRWYDPGTRDQPNKPYLRAGAELSMDHWGRLLPAVDKFPSAANGQGFKPLADSIHALGLRFGIHILRGIPKNAVEKNCPIEGSEFRAADAADTQSTCEWCPDMFGVRADTNAGQAYYDSLFRLFASWGIDYIKVDDISKPYRLSEIDAVRRAIDQCGRSIILSLSPGATPLAQAGHVAGVANMWRQGEDFWDEWALLDQEFALGESWPPAVGPGHWPDADMLPVGRLSVGNRSMGSDRMTRYTRDEQITLITLWSILPSPLMVGAYLPDNDAWTRDLLTNPDVLAVNQDELGAPGAPAWKESDREVWAKRLADRSLAVALFNRGSAAREVAATWQSLGLAGRQTVRDLWQRTDLGTFAGEYTANVPAHAAVLLIISPAK